MPQKIVRTWASPNLAAARPFTSRKPRPLLISSAHASISGAIDASLKSSRLTCVTPRPRAMHCPAAAPNSATWRSFSVTIHESLLRKSRPIHADLSRTCSCEAMASSLLESFLPRCKYAAGCDIFAIGRAAARCAAML
jgi:hypothetical protein